MFGKFLRIIALFFSCLNSFAQTNNPAPYCNAPATMGCCQPGAPNSPGNFVNDFINSFITLGASANINNQNTGCNGATGYVYWCNQYMGAQPGQVITCSVLIGNTYGQGIAIFVDWNQDNTFSTPAETVCASAGVVTAGTWSSYTFTVPPGQASGTYRMRARCTRFTPGTSISPCATYAYGETEDYNLYVGVPAPGPTTITPSSYTGCAGAVISLTASGGGPYLWSNGQTQPNTVVSLNSGTVVYASVPSGSCVAVNAISLTAVPGPTLALSPNTVICSGASANLTVSGASSYTWNPGAITGSLAVVNPTTSTIYTVTATNGVCPSFATVAVVVSPDLYVSATPSNVCPSGTTGLFAYTANTYTWFPGNLNGQYQVVTPSVSTTYTVWATVGACTGSASIFVNVMPAPVLTVSSSQNPACEGAAVTLSASGGISYTWNPGGASNSIAITPTAQSVYSVTATNGSCSATSAITQSVLPNPTVTAASNTNMICSGNPAVLTASGASTYFWSNGSAIFSTQVTPSLTTTYSVTGFAGLCTGSAAITVSVLANPSLSVQSSDSVLCAGSSATLTASGAQSYSWLPSGSGSLIVVSPTATTIYTLTGSNGICSSTYTVVQPVTVCTGLGTFAPKDQPLVFPNPFNDKIFIRSDSDISIFVYDIYGRILYAEKGNGNFTVNADEWDNGIYFMLLKSGSITSTQKLVKE